MLARVGEFGRVGADIFNMAVDHTVFVEREGGELDSVKNTGMDLIEPFPNPA